jgi:hypothetical protein
MAEVVVIFIFISWLLVELIIYWFKQKTNISDTKEPDIYQRLKDEINKGCKN